MARIRTIKPEFWSDFQLAQKLSRDQRLFYIGLWNEADDEGRFQAHPIRLKGAIFPYDDDLHGVLIEDSLRALAGAGKLVLYEVDGEPYGQLLHFLEHQKINRPTPSRIPAPPKHLQDSHGGISEGSVKAHGAISEGSPWEGKGREREKKKEPPYYPPVPNDDKKKRKTFFPKEWAPTDSHLKKATELGVDLQAEAEAFEDFHRSKDNRFVDWDLAFHTWLRNTKKYGPNGGRVREEVPLPKLRTWDPFYGEGTGPT